MSSPAISVIIPVYNPGEGIKKCIHMLQTQALSDIEMLFVDDCGTDSSMDVVREAAAVDTRIKILTNPENLGAGASRNYGIEEAKGEYVAFVDPDDYPERGFLELLYRKAVKTKPDIVKGERGLISSDGTRIKERLRIPLNTSIRFGLHMGGQIYDLFSYNHWTAIYRRAFLIENNIRYGLTRNSQDTTFLLRVGKAVQNICFEDHAIYNYVSRDHSRMRDFTHVRLQNELDAFDDQIEEMKTGDDEQYSFYKYIIGKMQYLLRIHATLQMQNETEAKWFLTALREKLLALPWINQITDINQTVRAFMLYDANLSLIPYRAQGVDNGLDEWVDVVRRITDFLKEHPEEGRPYAWMLKSSYRNVLSKIEDRTVSKEERLKVCQRLKDCLAELPEPELLTAGEPLTRLFLKTGMNLVPARQTVRELGRLISMKTVTDYLSKRDRRRSDTNASDKAFD